MLTLKFKNPLNVPDNRAVRNWSLCQREIKDFLTSSGLDNFEFEIMALRRHHRPNNLNDTLERIARDLLGIFLRSVKTFICIGTFEQEITLEPSASSSFKLIKCNENAVVLTSFFSLLPILLPRY